MRSLVLAFAAAALTAGVAHAADITVSDARIRPTPPGAPTAAGYVTLTNRGAAADRLIGASTPAAARVEAHEMSMTGGIMRMRPVAGGVTLPPKQTVRLAPGGMHLMLISPTRPLRAGDRVPMVLKFQKAGALAVDFKVGN